MWIAGRLGRTEEAQETAAVESGTVTIGGSSAGVLTRGEERELPVAAPGGYAWRPGSGERVLVLRGGTLGEERYVAAALDETAESMSLADGEVCLFARGGGARIVLRNSGRVEIEGELFINGKAYQAEEEESGGA